MRLKATKTSLYKLVSEYAKLPIMMDTQFDKAHRNRVYWLRWCDPPQCVDGKGYTAQLFDSWGRLLLRIETGVFDEESQDYKVVSHITHELSIAALRERGMIEE